MALVLARLTMDLLLSAANGVVATLLLKESGWRSLVPALLMTMLVARLERADSPPLALVVIAAIACLVVLLARGPNLHAVRLCAVVVCSLSTATAHVVPRLCNEGPGPSAALLRDSERHSR